MCTFVCWPCEQDISKTHFYHVELSRSLLLFTKSVSARALHVSKYDYGSVVFDWIGLKDIRNHSESYFLHLRINSRQFDSYLLLKKKLCSNVCPIWWRLEQINVSFQEFEVSNGKCSSYRDFMKWFAIASDEYDWLWLGMITVMIKTVEVNLKTNTRRQNVLRNT